MPFGRLIDPHRGETRVTDQSRLQRKTEPIAGTGLPARALTLGAGGGDSVFGPLGDEATLEMGDGAEHVKDEFAGGRRCVDFLFQAQQSDPAFFEGSDRGEQFGQRAPEPVEADHGERVPFRA